MKLIKNLTNQRFGRLIVVKKDQNTTNRQTTWLCRCDCGAEKRVQGSNLIHGQTKSCGCLRKEATKLRSTIHGLCNTIEYEIWCGMIQRCYNPNSGGYDYYGRRGITICDRWRDNFINFLADMGARPSSKHSIDRIDNDGNYEPSNCKWATKKEQRLNQRPRGSV